MEIQFQSNIAEIDLKIKKYQGRLRNKKAIHKTLAEKEYKRTRERITRTKVNPDGKPWAMWAASTSKSRARKGNTARGLLYDSGNLLNSINWTANQNEFAIGTNEEYAEYIQEGTPNMPSHEFLGFNERIEQDMEWLLGTMFK